MVGFVSPGEAVVHTVLVIVALGVLSVSVLAYLRRKDRRFLYLMVAFVLLATGQIVSFLESFYLNGYVLVPYFDIHLSHFIDLAMLGSFAAALLTG